MATASDRHSGAARILEQQKLGGLSYREASATIRDIGNIEPPKDWRRRLECKWDFKLFCEQYFPTVFYMPWSEDQLRCIEKIEQVVTSGGLFALAMPRGSGKTALCQTAVIWAANYGHRRYIFFIGDDQESAEDSLLSIKTEWESNVELILDFPEIAASLRAADGIIARFRGQMAFGQRVQTIWGSDKLGLPNMVFPKVPKGWKRWLRETHRGWISDNAGVFIRTKGITGGIRGAIHKHPITGELLRPDLFIADDVQTDQVAESPARIEKITRYLEGAVQGLAGPGEVISGIMPCTVIQQGDLADNFLDPVNKPEWKGERCAMVTGWPEGINDLSISEDTEPGQLWNDYARLRNESLQMEGDISLATEFYQKHQEKMDRDFSVSWKDRYNANPNLGGNVEISGQQHAMNLRLANPNTFASEYQNRPLLGLADETVLLSPTQIQAKAVAVGRREVPPWCEKVVTFVDLQDELSFFVTLAFSLDFSAIVTEYGAFPAVGTDYFTKSKAEKWCLLSKSYFERYPNERHNAIRQGGRVKAPFEPKIYHGLEMLCTDLLSRVYERDDGTKMKNSRLGIDANWGRTTETVKQFCRLHGDQRLVPVHGRFVGATSKPFSDWQHKPGYLFEDQIHRGVQCSAWVIPPTTTDIRHMLVDTNYYKTFIHNRFASPLGTPGAFTIHEGSHEMLAHHLCRSEYPEPVNAKGRTVDEWKQYPGKPDNDYLDCIVGCCALASLEGACLKTLGDKIRNHQRRAPRRKLSDLWRKKRAM